MPRKRKHSSEEEDEEPEEVESNVRTKRRAAVEARDRVAAKEGASDDEDEEEDDLEEEDDDKDEDYEGEGAGDEEGDEEGDEDDEEEDENEGAAAAEGDEDEEDDEVEDEEQEPDTVECIPADLEEPTKDTPGYVLKKKDSPKKMDLCFMGEMRETLVDVTEAFQTQFEEKRLPVLQVTKFDMIGDAKDTTQIDVLEIKYDKAYDIREIDDQSDDILSQNFYCIVRVDGIEGTWATQYFEPEPED